MPMYVDLQTVQVVSVYNGINHIYHELQQA